MTSMFDDQALHVAHIVKKVKDEGKSVVEVTAEAEAAWVSEIVRLAGAMDRSFQESCTPGYYNNEGQGDRPNLQNAPYTPGINVFNKLLAEWRAKDDMEGFDVR